MKSRVHPAYKTKYRVRNWASYDRALVRRGDVTVRLSPEAIATWEPKGVGKRGGQLKFSDLAIETALTLRLLFQLPVRTENCGRRSSGSCELHTRKHRSRNADRQPVGRSIRSGQWRSRAARG
jgi:hypothetical protein